jgi:hypothetical protein
MSTFIFYKKALLKSEEDAKHLYQNIYNPRSLIYRDANDVPYVTFITLLNKFSWIHMARGKWVLQLVDDYNNEMKRFISVLLDSIRTKAEERYSLLSGRHTDGLGVYIRDQELFD